ncbi:CDC42 binding protein kinase alpha-like protein [Sarcoptes scabiei]|uniref:CDC42 binding protein kinase alpha-like protein n=1 Tax=Sarcoptes scabiei TaxID=52283 RepID=A0A131ZVH4_SARSC|nr:CDC42 binding protein kinase alpha-like protein [Sarcoptes scabiei]
MSSFFERIKNKVFRGANQGLTGTKRKKFFHNIKFDENPEDTWKTVGELGDGAFGKVYKAQNIHNGMFAAAKICELKEDDLEDFVVEIDVLTECRHPNIVQMIEAYFFDGKLWMLIEFCEGGAIDSIMMDLEKPLNEEQIRYVCHEIVRGLKYLHEKKVIHRDLKAGNVLLTLDGDVKIADFGVSARNKNTVQKRDSFIGTPYWMAPEVIMCETIRDNPYDYKVDIWSLGITLIEFAQIEPPNHQMSPMRVLLKIQKGDPPKLDCPKAWSTEFNSFIAKCLTKDCDQRPTAAELLEHPFLKNVTKEDKKLLLPLISEYKAEVVEELTEVNDEEEIHAKETESASNGSNNEEKELSPMVETITTPTSIAINEEVKKTKRLAPQPPILGKNVETETNKQKPSPNENSENIPIIVQDNERSIRPDERSSSDPTTSKLTVESNDDKIFNNGDRHSIENCDQSYATEDQKCQPTSMETKMFETAKTIENGREDSGYQVTIVPKNHSTFIHTNDANEDKRNISIVTIEDNKNISIKTSEKPSDIDNENDFERSTEIDSIITSGSKIFSNEKKSPKKDRKSIVNQRFDEDRIEQNDSRGNIKTTIKNNQDQSSRTRGRSSVSSNHTAQKKTLKTKTRKFIIDGVVVTTTTQKVIYGDCDNKINDNHYLRKQELRELKMIQKHEIKQLQELECRSIAAYDTQEKKFDIEMATLKKTYDGDLESLIRQQKIYVERAEEQQQIDLKLATRRLKQDQERELKIFRDSLKAEQKLLKQEIDMLPKEKRKEDYRLRKEKLDLIHSEKERKFMDSLARNYEYSINKLNQSHREKLAMLERQFLQQKQQLLRAREAAIWELEEKHIYDKYILLKKQLNESFFLQRHQMLIRHEKELEHFKRMNNLQEEELLKRQAIEKRSLPKRIRSEMKTRELMFRESLRISMASLNAVVNSEDEREKLKRFQESEKQRYKAEQSRQELKHRKQIEDLKNHCASVIHELEQIQKDKKKALMEHETLKLKMLEDEHFEELKQWKSQLKPRKQKIEEEFSLQLDEQERFYATSSTSLSSAFE